MAGINRLGKAAPRPGSLRPPDPTRNRITDHFSENVEGLESDRDYQRAVQDIEDAQQTQGWLFGRGAFDKTDLLYLRDQEEKSRHTEIELHDREVQQYAQLRMKTDKQRPGGGPAAGSLGVAKKIDKDKSRLPPKVLQRVVKVFKAAGAPAAPRAGAEAATRSGGPQTRSGGPQTAATAAGAGADDPAGLGDLLGAYGSDSDDQDEQHQTDAQPAEDSTAATSPAAPTSRIPTAAMAVTAAAAAHQPPTHVGAAAARKQGRSRSPADHAEEELDYGT